MIADDYTGTKTAPKVQYTRLDRFINFFRYIFCRERRIAVNRYDDITRYFIERGENTRWLESQIFSWMPGEGRDLPAIRDIEQVLKIPFKKLPLYLSNFEDWSLHKSVLQWRLKNDI